MSLRAILWVFDQSKATLGRRLVLLGLAEYAHDDGTKAFPEVATLVAKTRMTRKAVQSALRKLEEDGEILCTGTTRKGTRIYAVVGLASESGIVLDPGEKSGEDGERGVETTPPGAKSTPSRGVEATPDPFDDPSVKRDVVAAVAAAWGKHAPPLIAHATPYFESSRFATAVVAALRTYELPALVKAIENYAGVLASPAHYWTHRYSAVDFLRRERATPGVEHFVDEAVPFENYRTKKDADRDGTQRRTPAEQLAQAEQWILNTAWQLPMEEWEVAEELGKRGVEGPDRARLLETWRSKRELAA